MYLMVKSMPLPKGQSLLFQTLRIMKLTAILIFSFLMQVSATGISQTVTISESNVPLKKVFKEIQKQTGYDFLYTYEVIQNAGRVSVSVKNVPLQKALDEALEGKRLEYKIMEKTVLIKAAENKAPSPVSVVKLEIPEIDVNGKVTDEIGKPLEGVSVFINSTKTGTSTNQLGEYRLQGVDEDAILVFSFVGYVTQTVRVKGKSAVNVTLKLKPKEQEEIMVTGYYSLPRERSTGSFKVIDNQMLESITALSLKDKLEGLVPGLLFAPNFNSDQDPTTERSSGIVIRGRNTLGDNSPLIVVDGFPVISTDGVSPWETINPEDVSTITVLKDAAAASIWGAQAANGVIVITTKDGGGRQNSTFSADIEYLSKPKPDLYEIPFASSKDAIDIYKYLFLETTYFNLLTSSSYRNRYEFPEVIDILLDMKTNTISTEEGNKKLAALSGMDVRDEFSNIFFRPENHKKATLSFQNISRHNTIRASLMGLKSNTFAKGDVKEQFITNINNTFKPVNWFSLSLGMNISLRKDKNNGVDIRDLQYIPQMSRILGEQGEYLPMIKQNTDFYYDLPTEKRRALVEANDLPYDWDWNLKREVDNKDIKDNRKDIKLNAVVKLKPFKQLDIDISYQHQNNSGLHSEYLNDQTWYVRDAVLKYYRAATGTFPIPVGGMLYEQRSNFTSDNGRFQAAYNNNFGDHFLRVLAGTEVRSDYRESIPYGYYGYDPQSLTQITTLNFQDRITPFLSGKSGSPIPPIPTLRATSININGRNDRYLSYYGNIGYTFKNRYDITGSVRLDQTNLYGRSASYRELPQWSFGAGYTISNEPFFEVKPIDYLRFKIAYGLNGLIDKSASPYISATPWIDPISQTQYAAVMETPNPALTWERTANLNLGIDFRVLDNTINGTIEFYKKKSTNVLADFSVNPTYGFYYDEATLNQGEITNKGIEVDLNAVVINRKIKWRTLLNYSFNRNKVVNVNSTPSNIATRTGLSQFNPVSGQPVDYIAVAEWAGFNDDGLLQVMYEGDVKNILEIPYVGANLDGLFRFAGQRSPKHFGSWINNVSYGNFELSVRLLYNFGHKFLNDAPPRSTLYNIQRFSNFFTYLPGLLTDRWQSPDDNETASMYGIGTRVSNYNATLVNDYLSEYNNRRLLNAGHIRLQSISLSYKLPGKLLGNTLKDARVIVQARNLGPIYLVNKKGIDPLFPRYSGSLYAAYFNTIRDRPDFSIGLNLGL